MTPLAPPDLPDAGIRVERLRGPLLAELRRPPGPAHARRRLAMAAATAALAAVAAALVPTVSNDATPALAVERDDGWLVLRVADVAAGEEALTRQLRDAGIQGEVRLLPVRPEDVGTWVVISERADPPGTPRTVPPPDGGDGASVGPPETVRLDRVRFERETLRMPISQLRESTGWFVFYAGREMRPGEEPWRRGDVRFRR